MPIKRSGQLNAMGKPECKTRTVILFPSRESINYKIIILPLYSHLQKEMQGKYEGSMNTKEGYLSVFFLIRIKKTLGPK